VCTCTLINLIESAGFVLTIYAFRLNYKTSTSSPLFWIRILFLFQNDKSAFKVLTHENNI